MTPLTRLTSPVAEPLSLAEIKAHLRIETDAEDGLIAGYLIAAREAVERYLRRALISQGWQLALDCWPEAPVRFPRPPLIGVDAVRIFDTDGGSSLVDPTRYHVESRAEPGFLLPAQGESLPRPERRHGGIEIDFTAGFGESWNDVPSPIRQALLMMIAELYEHRGRASPVIAGAVRCLLDPFRMISL